ncbi:MAG: phospholipid carrier-dependent glycosyltransferase [Gammaproteobacteria bacterium]|jgi:4-amino-4-deoxy-L-arabinose transferase-like glycosyltransferase|nr:phospholipid carrier-dependent glycosyltransferase [Gammaproteobacteria bacterium]|tara:strand:- start:45742 stop:47163 length:1422 start_codon:yes stop_codon:yes gene_type:complete
MGERWQNFINSPSAQILLLVALILAMRLAGLGLYPIMDTTEARYAEIARKMLQLGDWVVPMYTYEEPFWGKPPLAFWLAAVSMDIFGTNSFGARFPAWLCGVGTAFIIYSWAKPDRMLGSLAALLFVSSKLGYTATGDVTTDPYLMFAVSLAVYGFWQGYINGKSAAYFLGFVGMALGLLSKGIIAVVLIGIPIFIWLVLKAQLFTFLFDRRLLLGLLITVVITLPWYLLMESRSPGFLQYFIVGEHFERFVVSGWAGDKYGAGHGRPKGIISLYALDGLLPWSLLLLAFIPMIKPRWSDIRQTVTDDRWYFLIFWALSPILVFSLASNLLSSYYMPALPALCLLVAKAVLAVHANSTKKNLIASCVVIMALLIPAMKFSTALISETWYNKRRNQKPIIEAFQLHPQDAPLFYIGGRRFSAEFYSAGQVRFTASFDRLNFPAYVVLPDALDWKVPNSCEIIRASNEHTLYYCN